MKSRVLYIVVTCLLAVAIFQAFKPGDAPEQPMAKVNEQVQNLYVFHYCEPVQPYDSLGTMRITILDQTYSFESNVERLAINAAKKYPDANAIIVDHKGANCVIIKLRN